MLRHGLDADQDGTLQADEINQSRYICRGAEGPQGATGMAGPKGDSGDKGDTGDTGPVGPAGPTGDTGAAGPSGFSTLLQSIAEPAGSNCANGGILLKHGQDDNRDGILQADETEQSRFICQGVEGPQGATGVTGAQGPVGNTGPKGDTGTAGEHGLTTVLSVESEAPGSSCTNGGNKIHFGRDFDRDGTLDFGEREGYHYACHGDKGDKGDQGDQGPPGTPAPNATWPALLDRPADLVDGDDDTLAATQCNNGQILVYDTTSESWVCGSDQDTTLTASEVQTMLEAASTLGLTGNLEVDGTTTLKGAVTAEGGLSVEGPLTRGTVYGPNGYVEFTTDLVVNGSTSATQVYTLLDMRCSGHWSSYYVEIDLVTYYYRPSVRRYEYFCGNGNHSNGGSLVETQNPQAIGSLVSLSKSSPVDTGLDHSGIRMYDTKLEVSQGPYVQSYARVRAYGRWPTHKAGTPFSSTSPSAVWQTWTK